MKPALRAIPPGLHFVSTPIGAARDITLRALDVLAGADVLVAEDTRTLRHLMEIHGIPLNGRPLIAYHDHSGEGQMQRLVGLLAEGRSLAYASEAGTPLISDPGFELARAVAAAGLPMSAAPGPCAAICALTLSGLPSDRFFFAGFPPAAQGARRSFLTELAGVQATLICYESPKRLAALLADMAVAMGGSRQAVVCRELTKRFEEVLRGSLDQLAAEIGARDIKGEIVVLVDRAPPAEASEARIGEALDAALKTMSVKDAATFVSQTLGVSRKIVYRIALDRSQG
ncbi:16S rRNA (cytidine(1402)-2'-O)-methyltransferase [Tabrizicola sp.]|jgi:16S rRNA (cytidine1402-2'-O)-methyltransferase|uniref:16S rRNA (cytidine(1402)-2'-O)-methyltransferase n=1 Tax=Tabrizicola sp. TaxID=2005166 RepID=UPI001A5978F8|nr:16S rRNA (cytidine(1402)-2'-O)-methyltransferase [Tabrizicola sp.]MBL9061344.1 16S rRNA (cytidine(1402)-2'-O)-methyltransferase [Tabrizicola sp.]